MKHDERPLSEDERRLTELVRAAMGDRADQPFRPVVFYHKELDWIEVILRDCSYTQTLWSLTHPFRLLEDHYPEEGEDKHIGFVVECARGFCRHHLVMKDGHVDLGKLLDELFQTFPEISESIDICRGLIAQLGQPWVDIN